MVRHIPLKPIIPYINPILAISISAIWVFATIVMVIAGLCMARSRKSSTGKPSPLPPSSSSSSSSSQNIPENTQSKPATAIEERTEKTHQQEKPSTLKDSPVDVFLQAQQSPVKLKKKLMVSLSQKFPAKLAKTWSKREEREEKQFEIWKKAIILGEKCKIPSSDEEAIIYDQNGNTVAVYHPRTPRSLPVSRTNSSIDVGAIRF